MSNPLTLAELNACPSERTESELLACCGSLRWAQRMARRRPFEDAEELFAVADFLWGELAPEDWLEAFSKHPRIGEQPKQESAVERDWSRQEQAAAKHTTETTRDELAEANRAYQERFGYTFIVCATGKSAEEMLAILRERLQNDPGGELHVAAEEQRKITTLRLKKLLGL